MTIVGAGNILGVCSLFMKNGGIVTGKTVDFSY